MHFVNTLKWLINHPLNQNRRMQSLIHFVRWQIGSRMVSGPIVHEWVNGAKFIVNRGETGLTGNVYSGLHEFSDMAFLLHVLREQDLFIDVGANAGSYTILACGAIGANCYCFEPVPATYSRLVDNIRLNNLQDKIHCMNIGIGEHEGNIRFTSSLDCGNHVVAENEIGEDFIDVKVNTLDSILKYESPFFIKVDVEGFETPVLNGALKTLSNKELCAVIMELNGCGERYGFNESEILHMMHKHSFSGYSYDPFRRELIALDDKNLKSGNILFIRNKGIVSDRLINADYININGKVF